MRASQLFMPFKKAKTTDTLDLLINHGYLRQSTAGVFNLLPLGLRVQQRIESIIRGHLNAIGCQETSLATLASTDIWKQSGRLAGKDLFFVDQQASNSNSNNETLEKKYKYLLAPTAEEEITSMIAREVSSYRQLPLKLYQIGKKFRNEKRPRGGLLRGREFVMKDLYTFDVSEKSALETYYQVQEAYDSIFHDLGAPFVVAEADTGTIGGSLSHEYHFLSEAGEDTVVKCSSCSYTANLERSEYSKPLSSDKTKTSETTKVQYFLGADKDTLVAAYYPADRQINVHLINAEMPLLECEDEDPVELFRSAMEKDSLNCRMLRLIDPLSDGTELPEPDETLGISKRTTTTLVTPVTFTQEKDSCPVCNEPESLKFERAIEVGHTFYLGTKYSDAFDAKVQTHDGANNNIIQMGCYGIGVSRLIAAIAEVTKDQDGLCWPASVAPFDVLVIAPEDVGPVITTQLQQHGISALWDDRSTQFGLLLGNSKSLGFPWTVVAGKHFQKTGEVEVQPRSGSESVFIKLEDLASVFVK